MRRKALLYLFLILSVAVRGNIYFKHLGKSDGLSQISVLSICQDELDRIWFGTLEGLNCYDGNQIKTYKPSPDNREYPGGNEISNIVSDQQGNLFFTADGYLIRYNLHKDRFYPLQRRVQNLFAQKQTIWTTVNDSIFQWDKEKETFKFVYQVPLGKRIVQIYVDANNSLWIGTRNGLYRTDNIYNPSSPVCVIPDINVLSLYRDSRGTMWVATFRNGMYKIENGISQQFAIEKEFGISNNDVRCFVEDNERNIWLGTFNGLNKIDTLGQISYYQRENKPGSLSHSSVFALHKDRQGTIWVGTFYGGVNYFNPDTDIFRHYSESIGNENGLSFPFVGHMVEDKRGDVWICTEGGGLNCLERTTGRFTHYLMDPQSGNGPFYNLKCITYDARNDQLYIGTHKQGGLCFDIPSKRVVSHFEECGSSWTKLAFKNEKIYLLTIKGMFVKEGTEKFRQLFPDAPEANMEGNNFLIDSQNQLWITHWRMIVRINLNNPQEKRTYLYGENGLGNYYAQSIAEAPDGTLYFGTSGSGIYRFDREREQFIACTDIDADYCYNMDITPQGELVISNDQGLLIYHLQTKEKQAIDTESLHLSAINEGCGLLMCSDGETFVGGVEGMSSFMFSSLQRITPKYNLYFSSLTVNNRVISVGADDGILQSALPFVRQIELAHNENNFSISFSSNNYVGNANSKTYEYRLEGFSKEWSKTNGNTVTFTNLSPGTYKLAIREPQQTPTDTVHAIELPILIRQPWWNTWWMWAIYLCTTLIIGWNIVREARSKMQLRASLAQEKLEKEKNEELTQAKLQFFANISHEFRTPLTLIISQIETLLQFSSLSPTLRVRLQRMYKNTFQLKELISELLDFRKMEHGKLHLNVCQTDLIPYLKQIYKSFMAQAELHNIEYIFKAETACAPCWFDERQLKKVLTNLLSNAFKYTPKQGAIEIKVTDAETTISIQVIDSGKGIPEESLPLIFDRFYQAESNVSSPGSGIGLALSKGIIELHHGKIDVQSSIGYGSIFTVTLSKENPFENDDYVTFVEAGRQEPVTTPGLLVETEDDNAAKQDHETEEYDRTAAEEDNDAEEDNYMTEEMPELLSMQETTDKECILIVEDNEELLQLLTDLLSARYRVVTATNGKEGLQKAAEEGPDLILSDVMMPEMSGTELCFRIKNDFDLCHTPVVLLTALTSNDQKMKGLQCGADEYIGKPFDNKMLQAHIANILNNRKLLKQKFSQEMRMPDSSSATVPIETLAVTTIDADFLTQVEEIIKAHFTDPNFDVNTIASEMIMSRSAFYKKLKALTSMNPREFILNLRLKHATTLMRKNPDAYIAEISEQAGFSSLRYFRQCFKTHFNQTPQEYREYIKAVQENHSASSLSENRQAEI